MGSPFRDRTASIRGSLPPGVFPLEQARYAWADMARLRRLPARAESRLPGVLDGPGLPHDGDLDLAGVLELLLDLLGDVPSQDLSPNVVYVHRFDHDPDL